MCVGLMDYHLWFTIQGVELFWVCCGVIIDDDEEFEEWFVVMVSLGFGEGWLFEIDYSCAVAVLSIYNCHDQKGWAMIGNEKW